MDDQTTRSPVIVELSWGRMRVDGLGLGRDFKLWPGGGRPWDWRETGTHHEPGIQPADVEELIDHGCEVVVLSRGMHMRLETQPETKRYLATRGIEIHVEATREAVALYNQLAKEGARVGGLFHSTC